MWIIHYKYFPICFFTFQKYYIWQNKNFIGKLELFPKAISFTALMLKEVLKDMLDIHISLFL